MLINPYRFSGGGGGGGGELTIIRGTQSHDDRGVINYWYKYSTGILFIPYTDLTAIPNGAVIDKIAFEYDLILAPGGKTYEITNTYGWIYCQTDQSFTACVNSMLNNGLATSNTTYNAGIQNYSEIFDNPGTYSFTQETADPNIRYVDIPIKVPMTYIAGSSICIAIVNNSGSYDGSQTTPGWLGDTSTHATGKVFFRQQNDTTGPYSITASTTSADNTFKPNIKFYWQ
jgi:hypothetical protein